MTRALTAGSGTDWWPEAELTGGKLTTARRKFPDNPQLRHASERSHLLREELPEVLVRR